MKSLLIAICFICSIQLSAQSNFDERLLAKFSNEQLLDFEKNHPSVLAYWSYYLDHSYVITDVPANKSADSYPELKIKDTEDFNILEQDIHMDRNVKKYYRIKGMPGKVLILFSNSEFTEKFNSRANNL